MRKFLFVCISFLAIACSSQKKEGEAHSDPKFYKDLSGSSVAVLTGSTHDLVVTDSVQSPTMLRLNSSADILSAVASGLSKYAVLDSASLIGQNLEQRGIEIAFTSRAGRADAGFCFNLNDRASVESMNALLDSMRSDGTFAEIKKRWLEGDSSDESVPELNIPSTGEPIRVGVFHTFPFSFLRDGEWQGLEVEILSRYAQKQGRPITFTNMDFTSMIPALAAGKMDILAGLISITEERQKQVAFSDMYYDCNAVILRQTSGKTVESLSLWQRIKRSFHNNLIVENRWKLIVDALWVTFIISLMSILLGTIVGALICWMRMNRNRVLSKVAYVYVEIMRGLPILVFLMVLFYVIFAHSAISSVTVAIVAFSMYFGAYASEMFRTGISSVDYGQTEAGLALGFSKSKTFINFVMPQAVREIIPVFKGQAITLIKDTSVVGYIAIQDLTKVSDIIRSRTFDAFFPLILISIIYFLIAWLVGKVLDRVSTRMNERI